MLQNITDEDASASHVTCRWCGKLIGLVNHINSSVCVTCFSRLRKSRVPDIEIFGEEAPAAEELAV